MKSAKYIVIPVILLIAAGIYLEQTKSQTPGNSTTGVFNQVLNNEEGKMSELQNLGPAPEFAGISNWLNSSPLSLKDLRGKVVLVDFWTYSCINCIRTLPYVTRWYDTYKDKGFVVIGVHTPEFAFEKDTKNVQDAINRFKINYPVAQDNNYETWQNYNNQYWPAEYLIDKNGDIVYTHFGEGHYDTTENAIRTLLGMDADKMSSSDNETINHIKSPEMYFGTARLANLEDHQQPSSVGQVYRAETDIPLNTFSLEGYWKFANDRASLLPNPDGKKSGQITLRFYASKVHMVAAADQPITISVEDGQNTKNITVQASELYTIFESDVSADRTIIIKIPTPGFDAFTFTFG